ERVAERSGVDPGLVDLVDGAEAQAHGAPRLVRGQRDVRPEPENTRESLEFRHPPAAPVAESGGCDSPASLPPSGKLHVPGLGAPRLACLAAPPLLPLRRELQLRLPGVFYVELQQVKPALVLVTVRKSSGADPGANIRASEGGVDQADGNMDRALQLACEEEARGRPGGYGLRPSYLPAHGLGES